MPRDNPTKEYRDWLMRNTSLSSSTQLTTFSDVEMFCAIMVASEPLYVLQLREALKVAREMPIVRV